jgi:hypothetical protein
MIVNDHSYVLSVTYTVTLVTYDTRRLNLGSTLGERIGSLAAINLEGLVERHEKERVAYNRPLCSSDITILVHP